MDFGQSHTISALSTCRQRIESRPTGYACTELHCEGKGNKDICIPDTKCMYMCYLTYWNVKLWRDFVFDRNPVSIYVNTKLILQEHNAGDHKQTNRAPYDTILHTGAVYGKIGLSVHLQQKRSASELKAQFNRGQLLSVSSVLTSSLMWLSRSIRVLLHFNLLTQ